MPEGRLNSKIDDLQLMHANPGMGSSFLSYGFAGHYKAYVFD